MIGKLKGVIDSYGEDFIVLDVHGVGYLVHCSARTLQALPAAGEATTLASPSWIVTSRSASETLSLVATEPQAT